MSHEQEVSEKQAKDDVLFSELGRLMLDAMPEAACICDMGGQLLACNGKAHHLAKCVGSGEVTIDTLFQSLLAQKVGTGAVATTLVDIMRAGKSLRDLTLEIENTCGRRRPVKVDLVPLPREDGTVRVFICGIRELSSGIASLVVPAPGTASVPPPSPEWLFRQLLQALPVAVYTSDLEGKITFYNDAAARVAGRCPTENDRWCVGWKLLHPDGKPLSPDEYPTATALRDGRARYARPIVVVHPDGSQVNCEAYPTPLRDVSGALVGAVNVLIDTSERVMVEQSLRDLNDALERRVLLRTNSVEAALSRVHSSEREFSLLVESVLDYAIIALDLKGYVTRWNHGAERIFGYRAEDAIGRHFSMFHTPEDRALGVPEKMLETAKCIGRHEEEGWRLRKDGSRFWASTIVDPILDLGKSVGFAKITRDITERRNIEAALKDSERRARAVIDTAPDSFVQVNAASRITEWNPAATVMFGWTREEAMGKELVPLVVPESERARFVERLSLEHADTQQGDAGPFLLQTRNGDMVTVELKMGGQSVWGGDFFNMFIRDIGDKFAIETQLRQSQKMEALGLLAGGIAHDFNNLLQGIIGAIEIIDMRIKDGNTRDIARFTEGALNSAQRASSLTQRLLSFSRKQPLNPKRVNIRQLFLSVGELLQRTLGEGIELEFDLADDLWPCMCDDNQLESALLNLSINARDAMPSGGRLTIRSVNVDLGTVTEAASARAGEGQFVLLSVSDTGVGIPEKIVEHVFDPFFTTKEIGRGTGLGLSMVYGFAQQSGGHCDIQSTVDHGTTVRIFLPRCDAAQTDPVPSESGIAKGAGQLVLVVEDEPLVRSIVVQVLHELGYATREAADGEATLELLQSSEPFDLLVSDIGLPGMDGEALADAARRLFPNLKILLMSGYARSKTMQSSDQRARKWPVITKPFSTAKFAERVSKVMGR